MVIEKILVPVDFSPSSRLALDHALVLAERFGARVHVFHAWDLPGYLRPDLTVWSGEVSQSLAEHARADAEKSMIGFLEDAGIASRDDVTHEVVSGTPFTAVLEKARDGAFDLVVMGTHGRTGLSHLVMGSVAENVVRRATCPVLTVRAPESK